MDDTKRDNYWLTLGDLQEPFNDAVNYKTRQQKEFFSKIFLRTEELLSVLKPSVYYLIGEKGSGKTAYAVYLESNDVEKTRCRLSTMTETQYKRFITLKKRGKLEYSDYANIWRPMLLNMVAQALVQKSKGFLASVTGKFDQLEQEIEQFNKGALNPEVDVAFEMVNGSIDSLAIGHDKIGKAELRDESRTSEKTESIKHHLLEKETGLKQALADLSLRKDHVLFVDGIDYRPEDVPYADYLACVKGLGEAVWQLNSEFFANIRDSKGRLKVVLLVRPDVFHKLNLYNSNSRLRDNSVLLDWSTTEAAMRSSRLYEATGKYFSSQQPFSASPLEAADNYLSARDDNSIFRRLIRTSFQKPRDILTFVRIARNVCVKQLGRSTKTLFEPDVVRHPTYTKDFSDYLLGEVRDYSDFYMKQEDFFLYIKFFQYLDGKGEFSFEEFARAYEKFKQWISGEKVHATEYLRDAEALLQFFFDVNVIGYRESMGEDREKFVHFSFRERTLTNIAPKVKTTAVLVINPGVAKALDIGLQAKTTTITTELPRRNQTKRMRGKRGGKRNSAHSSSGQQPTKSAHPTPAANAAPGIAKPLGTSRRRRPKRPA